jgi:hypothetical protein
MSNKPDSYPVPCNDISCLGLRTLVEYIFTCSIMSFPGKYFRVVIYIDVVVVVVVNVVVVVVVVVDVVVCCRCI